MSDKVYQQVNDYIPQTDGGLRDWLQNYSTLIAANPGRYGLEVADAVVISGLYDNYNTLYNQVQSSATRTPGLVTQKDAVRASAVASVRVYSMQIKSNAGVDNQDKIELGIHVNDPTPTPIPAPSTMPLLAIVGSEPGVHFLRYADSATPNSRAKPHGVTQLELYVHIGPTPVVDWQEATFADVFTRNPIEYTFTPDQANLTATYFARWRTARGLKGPMSLPVALGIAFGGPVEQMTITGGTPESLGGDGQMKIAA